MNQDVANADLAAGPQDGPEGQAQAQAQARKGADQGTTPDVDVVYHVNRIAYELVSDMHSKGMLLTRESTRTEDGRACMPGPSALVMLQGKAARQAHSVLVDAGIAGIMPMTGDWRLDSNPKLAYDTVPLGSKPTAKLFANAHAVLQAAQNARVQAIFLGGSSLELADDNRFLQRAGNLGMRVYKTIDLDPTLRGWVECEPGDKRAPQPTVWRTCHACGLSFDNEEFVGAGYRCPSCDTLARMSSEERIAQIADEGSFVEWDRDVEDVDPLDFPEYAQKIASYREKTGRHEAVRTGVGTIGGVSVAMGFMDSSFLMGSMGSVVGEKVSRLFDRATDERLPVLLFCASGGARMQEGLASLMQMAKTACAVERHDRAGLLYVSVITDPTTGGVTASFATLGDVIFAEPGALVGFAGQRVIRDTIKQDLPEGFQTAEFALEHGLIDAIVEREDLRETLRAMFAFHQPHVEVARDVVFPLPTNEHCSAAKKHDDGNFAQKFIGSTLERFMRKNDSTRQRRELERHAQRELKRLGLSGDAEPGSAWESVQLARNVHRPTASMYIKTLSPSFLELHGDREFADDAAIIAGLGRINGRPVTIIAQEKGTTLPERIKRNFGCPQPEGYRKTARLMRQAEKFGRPIVCLVDTQGAFCGTHAEERGQGNAIAENLQLMAGLHVPVVSVLLGEGGSGGALALAVANKVAMQEHAVYSVLSPEGFASILWKDGTRAPEAAEVMGMSASDVFKLGVVDAVLSEGEGPAHENPKEAAGIVLEYVNQTLEELSVYSPEELLLQRQARFAAF